MLGVELKRQFCLLEPIECYTLLICREVTVCKQRNTEVFKGDLVIEIRTLKYRGNYMSLAATFKTLHSARRRIYVIIKNVILYYTLYCILYIICYIIKICYVIILLYKDVAHALSGNLH
jgi:hypothetical protein